MPPQQGVCASMQRARSGREGTAIARQAAHVTSHDTEAATAAPSSAASFLPLSLCGAGREGGRGLEGGGAHAESDDGGTAARSRSARSKQA